jgi:autophagy-related protein 5
MSSGDVTKRLRQSTWHGSIPLEIRLHKGDCRTYDESDPYLVCATITDDTEAAY